MESGVCQHGVAPVSTQIARGRYLLVPVCLDPFRRPSKRRVHCRSGRRQGRRHPVPLQDGHGAVDPGEPQVPMEDEESNWGGFPKVAIGKHLAKAIGWIRMGKLQNGQPGYVLGFNLRKEFLGDRVLQATDLIEAQNNGDEIFYKIDDAALWLSCFSNWRFTNADEAFAKAFGTTHDTLYVYSNVGQSQVTGHHVTDLLREVPYPIKDERSYYEVQTIQYLPVRNDVIDIVEVQVAENGGTLAPFVQGGLTQLTLHLKYE